MLRAGISRRDTFALVGFPNEEEAEAEVVFFVADDNDNEGEEDVLRSMMTIFTVAAVRDESRFSSFRRTSRKAGGGISINFELTAIDAQLFRRLDLRAWVRSSSRHLPGEFVSEFETLARDLREVMGPYRFGARS